MVVKRALSKLIALFLMLCLVQLTAGCDRGEKASDFAGDKIETIKIDMTTGKINSYSEISPSEVVMDMSPGWNLANTLDAIPNEGSWGNIAEEKNFEDIRAAGFKSVRIPVTWEGHIKWDDPELKIDPKWMDRVEQVVDWALEKNLYVILNSQHDTWITRTKADSDSSKYSNNIDENIKKFELIWAQIAKRFKGKSEKLMFEVLNSPDLESKQYEERKPANLIGSESRNYINAARMNEINRRIINVIRASGENNATRNILITPLKKDDTISVDKEFVIPDSDSHIMVAVHYYASMDFIRGWYGKTTWGSKSDVENMDRAFKELHDKFTKKGIQVVVDEFGNVEDVDRYSKLHYFDTLVGTAYKYNISTMLWDNGGNLNRKTSRWSDSESKDVIVNAGRGIRNSLVYPMDAYFKNNSKIDDLKVSLNLNGNKLVGIYNGSKKLSLRSDYVINKEESSITLKSKYINKLLSTTEVGNKSVLQFRFTRGAKQDLNIIKYKSPKFVDGYITLDLRFQTQYDKDLVVALNGTRISSIEVISQDGREPVRYSWTPYLRLNEDYVTSDYKVTLKPSLLESIKEDSIIKFNFWPTNEKIEMKVKIIK